MFLGALKIQENLKQFKPTFLAKQYEKQLPKKSKKIFVGSMSDIAFWKEDWIMLLIEKILRYPQHTFQLLTKFPDIYFDYKFPKNCLLGITVDTENQLKKVVDFFDTKRAIESQSNAWLFDTFISFEPLLIEHLNLDLLHRIVKDIQWVIIGTMSGRNRIPSNIEQIRKIVKICNAPVFIKQLEINGKVEKDIYKFPEDLRLRNFPKKQN